MKIICIGWNYLLHNKELGGKALPTEPTVFLKPDSALLLNNKPFFIPDFSSNLHYETELVVKINRLGKNISKKFAHRYYNEIGLGIDFTARDLQNKLRAEGGPWEISKAFDGSAVVGDFVPVENLDLSNGINFNLNINDKQVQYGNSKEMIFCIDEIIEYVSQFFTLKIGDLIFTGTPEGVGAVKIGDRLEGYIENTKLLDFHIK